MHTGSSREGSPALSAPDGFPRLPGRSAAPLPVPVQLGLGVRLRSPRAGREARQRAGGGPSCPPLSCTSGSLRQGRSRVSAPSVLSRRSGERQHFAGPSPLPVGGVPKSSPRLAPVGHGPRAQPVGGGGAQKSPGGPTAVLRPRGPAASRQLSAAESPEPATPASAAWARGFRGGAWGGRRGRSPAALPAHRRVVHPRASALPGAMPLPSAITDRERRPEARGLPVLLRGPKNRPEARCWLYLSAQPARPGPARRGRRLP